MNVIIFGATGMVGTEVLHQCLQTDQVRKVLTVGRHITGVNHPKLQEIEHQDFRDYSALAPKWSESDVCFYCLGVYQNQVSAELFWEITVDYLSALLGTLAPTNQKITFCLFSSMGADPTGKNPFRFAKAKGRAEQILSESPFRTWYVFRPGYINPGRTPSRAGFSGWVAQPIYKLFPSIGIDAFDLAKVMVKVGLEGSEKRVLENKDMRILAQ